MPAESNLYSSALYFREKYSSAVLERCLFAEQTKSILVGLFKANISFNALKIIILKFLLKSKATLFFFTFTLKKTMKKFLFVFGIVTLSASCSQKTTPTISDVKPIEFPNEQVASGNALFYSNCTKDG